MSPWREVYIDEGMSKCRFSLRGREYPWNSDMVEFERGGSGSASSHILPVFAGDEFISQILEGQWIKNWDSDMGGANQPFTAILDGSSVLQMEGEAAVSTTIGNGWLNCRSMIPLLDEVEIVIAMKAPVDVTGGAGEDLIFAFYLREDFTRTINPKLDDNSLLFRYFIDENGLLLQVIKEVEGTPTTLFDGSTYDDTTVAATGDLEATIWRIVFHDGDPSEAGVGADKHMHVHLRQAATILEAEEATENELSTSPFDLSNLVVDNAYPALHIGSGSTSYYDDTTEAEVDYIRVKYPDVNIYSDNAAGYNIHETEIWDGDPDNGGKKVYDVDHVFSDDIYLQNGIVRTVIRQGAENYFIHYFWESGSLAYVQLNDTFQYYLNTSADHAHDPYLEKIVKNSTEEVVLQMRLEGATAGVFVRFLWTIKRGLYTYKLEPLEIYPQQVSRFRYRMKTNRRFGWAGDISELDLIADDNVSTTAQNTAKTDNVLIRFDEDGVEGIMGMALENQVTLDVNNAGELYPKNFVAGELQVIYFFVTPYPKINKLLVIYSSMTTTGSTVIDALATEGNVRRLNAVGEYARYDLTGITDIPRGRYTLVIRAKDSNQIANDFSFTVYNQTDGYHMSEIAGYTWKTMTGAFQYYAIVFDVRDEDDGDAVRLYVQKRLGDANDLDIDHFLVVPVGNGSRFPQDLAHNAMRNFKQEVRRFVN